MKEPILSTRKSHILSTLLFLVGLLALGYFKTFWPSILLVIGIPLALRQYLVGNRYDMAVSLFVFIGAFITAQFDIAWEIVLPVIFTIGGLYILFREFFGPKEIDEVEKEIDQEKEIEEETKK
ncbi:MAG: hypothetical protein HZB76_02225 [Chlamydiae bacterium]|nr:hypothetical protein [Chlamydiota bacterium]